MVDPRSPVRVCHTRLPLLKVHVHSEKSGFKTERTVLGFISQLPPFPPHSQAHSTGAHMHTQYTPLHTHTTNILEQHMHNIHKHVHVGTHKHVHIQCMCMRGTCIHRSTPSLHSCIHEKDWAIIFDQQAGGKWRVWSLRIKATRRVAFLTVDLTKWYC